MKINALVLTILGNHGAGKVLTSDASGNATWQTPSVGDAGVWSGGTSSTVFVGTPLIRCGGSS